MDIRKKIIESALQSGIWQTGLIDTKDLVFYEEIREICKGNVCRNYGATWACPPAIGTIEECKNRAMQYGKMLLFSIKYLLEDPFDIEGMRDAILSRSFRCKAENILIGLPASFQRRVRKM